MAIHDEQVEITSPEHMPGSPVEQNKRGRSVIVGAGVLIAGGLVAGASWFLLSGDGDSSAPSGQSAPATADPAPETQSSIEVANEPETDAGPESPEPAVPLPEQSGETLVDTFYSQNIQNALNFNQPGLLDFVLEQDAETDYRAHLTSLAAEAEDYRESQDEAFGYQYLTQVLEDSGPSSSGVRTVRVEVTERRGSLLDEDRQPLPESQQEGVAEEYFITTLTLVNNTVDFRNEDGSIEPLEVVLIRNSDNNQVSSGSGVVTTE